MSKNSTKVSKQQTAQMDGLLPVSCISDLDKRKCSDCCKKVYVLTITPPENDEAYQHTTGIWVTPIDDSKNFVLCNECAGKLYDEGRLGFGCDSGFMC